MKERLEITNSRTGILLGESILVARTLWTRFIGFMGQAEIQKGNGLLFEPCNQVQMCFMRFSIDLIFLSKQNTILYLQRSIRPWRISRRIANAEKVLEIPVGIIEQSRCEVGDQLVFRKIEERA